MLANQSSEDHLVTDYPPVGLPGFEVESCRETRNGAHLSLIGVWEGLVFELIISKSVIGFGGSYLVTRIKRSEDRLIVWEFKGYYDEGCIAVLLYSDEYGDGMIAIVREGNIIEVLPLSMIAEAEAVSVGGKRRWRIRMDLEKAIRLKESLARTYRYGISYSAMESRIMAHLNDEAHRGMLRRLEKQQAMDDERRLQYEAAREKLVADVMARGMLECWDADGRKFSGYPVEENEWPSLPIGTRCVLNVAGEFVYFCVRKDRSGFCSKEGVRRVFLKSPIAYAKPDIPEVVAEILFCVGKVFVSAFEVAAGDLDGMAGRMREGDWLAVRNPGSAGDYSVYRVSDGKPFEVDDHLEPEA